MRKTRAKITVLDTEYATLWFYPDTGILHHQVHKFMARGSHQELLKAGAKYLEEHGATKWLSDNRSNTVLREQDVDFATNVWMPRALKAGFRYWALVMPKGAIGQMQMGLLVEDYAKRGLTARVFEGVTEAMAWLEAVGNSTTKGGTIRR